MRTYGEAIDVRTGGDALSGSDAPAQFLWRGRLYLVRDVLAHWVELGTWWSVRGPRTPRGAVVPRPPSATSPAPGRSSPGYSSPGYSSPGHSAAGEPARSVAADVGAVEREVWRVEASTGRSSTSGVYDLVRDVPAVDPRADATGPPPRPRWRLARALD